jgi:hypothetical protein
MSIKKNVEEVLRLFEIFCEEAKRCMQTPEQLDTDKEYYTGEFEAFTTCCVVLKEMLKSDNTEP